MLRQTEPERLVTDLVAALKQRIETMYMQRVKLPLAESVLRSIDAWRWCLALQPPILFNRRQLGDIAVRVIALVDVVLGVGEKPRIDATQSSSSSSLPSSSHLSQCTSPIKFIITGQPGDGKTLSVLSLFLQDHVKNTKMTASIKPRPLQRQTSCSS